MGIALNLYVALNEMDILTMSILQIMNTEYLSISLSFSISFNNAVQFSVYRSFTSFVKFIPRYFILFVAIAKGIVLFFSFLFLKFYCQYTGKQWIFFCVCTLILYPETLLYLFIFCKHFLVESSGFYVCRIMTAAKSDTFTSSFLIWMSFISFPCLIVLARTSRMMMNEW